MADIGKLALTVTANAAPLEKSLDAVEKKTKATGDRVEKNLAGGDGGGSGFLSGMLGGAVVAGLAAVGKGVAALVPLMADARKNALALGQTFSAMEHAKLEHVERAFHGVQSALSGVLARTLSALEPAITALASAFVQLLTAAQPAITWIAEKIGTGVSYAVQTVVGLVKILASQAVELWESFGGAQLVEEWFGKWPTWGDVVKGVLKGMAIGFAYVWDTIKAGAGVAISTFGTLAQVVGKVGDSLGFDWGKSLIRLGATSSALGTKMISDFGKTKLAIDKLFDGMGENAVSNFARKFTPYQASAALIAGSKEEYSVRTKFSMESKLNPQVDVAKQQLAEARKANQLLEQIKREAGRDIVFGEI